MRYLLGKTVRVGDICQRISKNKSRSLEFGETYTVTQVNRVSARGLRKDGISVNQHCKSIKIVHRKFSNKILVILNICKCLCYDIYTVIKN